MSSSGEDVIKLTLDFIDDTFTVTVIMVIVTVYDRS